MKTYAGIDLHSSNNYIVVIDENDERLFEKRLPNTLEEIIQVFEQFKKIIEDNIGTGHLAKVIEKTDTTKRIGKVLQKLTKKYLKILPITISNTKKVSIKAM